MIDYLETSKVCSEIILSLINNILDSGKSDLGSLEIDRKPTDLRNLISDLWKVFVTCMSKKNLKGLLYFDKKIP